jgi:hypothetical protein
MLIYAGAATIFVEALAAFIVFLAAFFKHKAVSCFSDEDLIGCICAIAQLRSHQGIVHGCLRKYLSAMYSTLKLTL